MKRKSIFWLLVGALLISAPMLMVCAGEPAAPAPEPAETPISAATMLHPIEGAEECLICHETGEGGASLMPDDEDHAARTTDDICVTCHQPAE